MKVSGILFIVFVMALDPVANAKEEKTVHLFLRKDSVPVNMLIINSFDAMSMKARKNKKELFGQLADSLKQILYNSTPPPLGGRLIIVPELVRAVAHSDSVILVLLANNNASKAIIIKDVDASFYQTHVDVVKEKDGKTRTAFYDICAKISYQFYSKDVKMKESDITSCEFFTKRNVMSGLFAAGPDIVGKKKEAFKIIRKNALDYISKETPWK